MTSNDAKKKILFLAANPTDTTWLRLDKEVKEIEARLQRASQRHMFELVHKGAIETRDIHQTLLDIEPHIVHFSGHGARDGGLAVEDAQGKLKLIEPRALAGLFELFADVVECVLLNTCYSATQAEALSKHINYVIGMSNAISDQTAIEFAASFYDALGAGKSIEFAFELGCRALRLAACPEHAVLKGKLAPPPSTTRKWILVLSATLDEVDRRKAEAIVEHLRQLSQDASITLREVLPGSVRLIVESSEHGFKQIERLIREKRLTDILGLPIQDIQYIKPGSGAEPKSHPQEPQDDERIEARQVDVIVLLRKTTQAVATWRYATDRDGRFFILNENGDRQPPREAWEQLAAKIKRLACNDSHTPVDVFLFLRGRLLENLYDYGRLEYIINDARDHAWGGNLYIAWDQKKDTAFDWLYERHEPVLEEWFRLLRQSGVTDLIEVPKKARANEPDEYKILRAAALESENRREKLRRLVNDQGWGWVLPNEAYSLTEFLERLVRVELLPADSKNQAVFYDRKPHPRCGLTPLLEQSRRLNRSGNRLVAAVKGIDAKVLEELWGKEPLILQPLFFNGVFEWLYALLRLDQAGHRASLQPPVAAGQHYIESVEPAGTMQFQSTPAGTNLRLLVTSAFHPSQNPHHYLDAAKEIGALFRVLPFHVEVQVHPCITCEDLPNLLRAGPFAAWLHLSDGDQSQGLYEAETKQYASPERWLACLNDYRGSLQLVILSVCESAPIARLLAALGVRVAIGFQNKIAGVATRKLVEIVVPAALQAGDRQGDILDAFREICRDLSSRAGARGGLVDTWPRAFKVELKSS